MKKILLFIVIALGFCTYTFAESKTEIVVKEGLVKTSTDQGDSLVRSGQRAILEEGKEPAISFNWTAKSRPSATSEPKIFGTHQLRFIPSIRKMHGKWVLL